MGQAPPGDSYNNRGQGVPLVAGAGDFSGDRLAPTKYTTRPSKLSSAGDIVLSIRASIGAKVWADGEYCLGRGVAGLRALPGLEPRFLWHWLTHAERELAAKGRGATFLQVNLDDISEMRLSLPPIDEQRRTMAILDHADTIRAKRRQSLALFDHLIRSTFHCMFAGPLKRARLKDIGVDFLSGKNVLGDETDAHLVNRVIKVSAISSGRFLPSESKPMPRDYSPPAAHRLQRGDILFGRASGTLGLLGATAVVDVDPVNLYLPDKVWRLTTTPNGPVLPAYVLGVLRSSEALAFIRHNASGAAGVRNIGKGRLLEFTAQVPPIQLQREFGARVDAINAQRALVERVLAADDELFAALQARAFRG